MAKLNASLPIGSKSYTIREGKTIVKGREYSRFIVDFGKYNKGSRVRQSYKTKAAAAIRERVAKDRSRA